MQKNLLALNIKFKLERFASHDLSEKTNKCLKKFGFTCV